MGKREQTDGELINFNSLSKATSTSVYMCGLVEYSSEHGGPRSFTRTYMLGWEAIEGDGGTWRASHSEAQNWPGS